MFHREIRYVCEVLTVVIFSHNNFKTIFNDSFSIKTIFKSKFIFSAAKIILKIFFTNSKRELRFLK